MSYPVKKAFEEGKPVTKKVKGDDFSIEIRAEPNGQVDLHVELCGIEKHAYETVPIGLSDEADRSLGSLLGEVLIRYAVEEAVRESGLERYPPPLKAIFEVGEKAATIVDERKEELVRAVEPLGDVNSIRRAMEDRIVTEVLYNLGSLIHRAILRSASSK